MRYTPKRVLSSLAAIAVAVGLLLAASPASAFFVATAGDEDNIAKAILAVDIDSSNFLVVDFDPATANDVYGSMPRNFFPFDNEADASAAVDALNFILNDWSGRFQQIDLVGGVLDRNNDNQYAIGFGDVSDNIEIVLGRFDSASSTWVNAGVDTVLATDELIYADFFVPVPAAAWLFGSALGLLGWVRRRRV